MSDLKEINENRHAKLAKRVVSAGIPVIKGLVLAGGESRRMGSDKGSMQYRNMTQRDHAWYMLAGLGIETFLSCHPLRVPDTDAPVITDTFLDLGPYGGLLSAFRFDPNAAWLIIACDMPLVEKDVIEKLINGRDPGKLATCFHNPATDLPEPLLSIWEPDAYTMLLSHLSMGNSCLRKFLTRDDCKKITGVNADLLRNANSPEESEELRQMIQTLNKD